MNFDTSLEADSYLVSRELAEYLFVLIPDKILTLELIQFQARLIESHKNLIEPLPIRHIVLASLLAKNSVEGIMSSWIRKACMMQPSFDIDFKPQCSFNQGVIFLELDMSEALRRLQTQLKITDDFLQASGCHPMQMLSRPHLPLAVMNNIKGNDEPQYQSVQSFSSVLKIKEVSMLRRRSEDQLFEKANVFGLSM